MDIIITDTIQADQIEDGDQILFIDEEGNEDAVENVVVHDHGYVIVVKGFSNNEGDTVTYRLDPSDTVDVWSI